MRKQIFLILGFIVIPLALFSNIIVNSSNEQALEVSVSIPEVKFSESKLTDGNTYSILVVPGSSKLAIGKPDVPGFANWILIPNGTSVNITTFPGEPEIYEDVNIPPVQPPLSDYKDAPLPPFTKNELVFSTDAYYPGVLGKTEPTKHMRGQTCTILWIYPYQYNPVQKILKVYSDLRVNVNFIGAVEPIPTNLKSENYNTIMQRISINAKAVLDAEEAIEIDGQRGKERTEGCELLIMTHSNFENVANTLATWKIKRGITTKVISTTITGNDTTSIRNYIVNACQTWNPAPSYLLFVGDAEFIPTWYANMHPAGGGQGHTGTDIFYADTDDPPDYIADLAYGRLSIDTDEEADSLVARIIRYERTPPDINSYYSSATMAACFQDGHHVGGESGSDVLPDSIADRRFAKTCEDVKNFLDTQGYSTQRIYTTLNGCWWNNDEIFPKYWSDSLCYVFENDTPGEEIPDDLQKPAFPWNGNTDNITNAINNGRFFLLHRDHGLRSEWWKPSFNNDNVDALNNGEKRPIVWSVNCETGWFDNETDDAECNTDPNDECFVEHWLIHSTGGSIGLIGATRVSYSGINDRLIWGWMDSIWPGFYATWGGTSIFKMGDVINYGKAYMMTFYANDEYRRTALEEFHWFGDPTMEIWTDTPQNLTVTFPDTLFLNTSSFTVSVTNSGNPVENALVCIMKDDEVYETGETDASGDITLPLSFQDEGRMYVTVTAHNFIPYEDSVLVLGHLECSANPSAIYADETSTSTLYAVVKDSDNNTISIDSLMINFSIISGSTSAHLEGTNPSPTIDGIAQITLCADDTPGIVKVAADNDGLEADTVQVYVITDPSNIIVSDPIMIDTSSTSYQAYPKVAFDGTNYFTVWVDYRDSDWNIYGIRLSAAGEVLDDSAFLIINYDYIVSNPDVVYGGNYYLVICREAHPYPFTNMSPYARVSPAGAVIDTICYTIDHDNPLTLISYCGDTYIAITSNGYNFYSILIDEGGNASYVSLCYPNFDNSYSYDIAFNGNHYQIVWYVHNPSGNIYTRSVDIFGNFFDNYASVDTSAGDQLYPTIATDGDNFLVVWEDRSDGNDYNIFGARINNNGEVIDDPPIVISDADNHQQTPSITFDGSNYWVVWVDGRDANGNDIYGTRVMPSGVVLDPTGILLVERNSACLDPHIVAGPEDQLAIVYSSYETPPYDNYRIFTSIIGTKTAILELTDASGAPGTSSSWSYATLNTLEDISTLQFTMKFNSLLSIDSLSLANQFSNMELDYNVFSDSVNVLVYSPSGYTIQPESEPVVYFYYSVSLSASLGDIFPLTLSNIVIVDANVNEIPVSGRNGNFYVTSKGDINFDFIVNALDLQRCINIILGRPPSPTPAELFSADVAPLPDGDGSVNILDVTGIVNIILGRSRSIQIALKSNPKSRMESVLSVGNGSGIPGNSNIPVEIKLNNDESVAGIQFSLFFENNILAVDSVSLSPRSSNMTLAYNTWEDSIKVLIYSASGYNILPDTSSIATVFFSVSENTIPGDTTNIQINGIVLADPYANPMPSTGEDGLFQVEGNPAYTNIKVLLEGPYDAFGDTMECSLTLPTISPYDSEDIGSLPTVTGHNLVDWIQVKLRTTETGTTVDSCNAFLLEDGSVVDVRGNSSLPFYDTAGNDYYIVIHHRNHLDIISAVKHTFGSSQGEATNIDLTTSGSIYGDGYQELETGVYGMYSGDINNDREVTTLDYTSWYNEYITGSSGYKTTDLNMDGEVTTSDYTKWYNNFIIGASSSIPSQTRESSGGSKNIIFKKIENNTKENVWRKHEKQIKK